MKISFVIPCYKSKNTIDLVIDEITEVMKKKINEDYEIILVNDCSPDDTFEHLKKISSKNSNIKVVNLVKNVGQAAATMCGLNYASGDYIVVGDDDGQTPFSDLPLLKEKLEKENYDVVCGKYIDRDQKSFIRNLGSKINEKMAEVVLDQPKDLYLSAFLIARRFVIDEMIRYKNPYPYIAGLLLRTTNNIGNVDVKQRDRTIGKSGYNIRKLLSLWMNGFTTFSIKPLRISTICGFVCSFIGFIFTMYLIINKLINSNVAIGWSSLMAVILIVGGIIMMMLGMIGEYIGRIYISINQSPQYIVKESINFKEKK